MCVTEKDVYHGSVLAKILCGNPGALRLIEWRSDERTVYQVDGLLNRRESAYFYLKYCAAPKEVKKTNGHCWNFTFSADHIQHLRELMEKEGETYVTLVCGRESIKDSTPPIQICLLFEDEIRGLLNLDALDPGGIRVEYRPAKQLRAFKYRNSEKSLSIPANRLDKMTSGVSAA